MSAHEKLHYIAKQAAVLMLQQYGVVPPFGVILDRQGEPITHYPDKRQCADPEDPFGSMCDLVLDYLQAAVDQSDPAALALVTQMDSGEDVGFAVQVETPGTVSLLVYPCSRQGTQWIVDEPFVDDQGAILFDDAFPFWKQSPFHSN